MLLSMVMLMTLLWGCGDNAQKKELEEDKDIKQENVDECNEAEACVSNVEDREHQGTDDNGIPNIWSASDGGHQIAAEEHFLTHSLEYEGDKKQHDHGRVDAFADIDRYATCDFAGENGSTDHQEADDDSHEVFSYASVGDEA